MSLYVCTALYNIKSFIFEVWLQNTYLSQKLQTT